MILYNMISGEKMAQIIRVLYGEFYPKMWKEVHFSLMPDEQTVPEFADYARNEIVYYVLGWTNGQILRQAGAKNVVVVDHMKKTLNEAQQAKIGHFYNKTYLIQKAMEDHKEILCLDYDAICVKYPDQHMWDLVSSKFGKFDGEFKCPAVRYKRRLGTTTTNGGLREWSRQSEPKHSLRIALNTCALYCSNKDWIDGWEESFHDHPTATPPNGGGEAILMYYLDKRNGLMSIDELVDNFENPILALGRGVGGLMKSVKKTKKEEDIYFYHI